MEPMIVIGNPDNRRTAGLQEARDKLGLPPAHVVPYLELLRGERTLAEAAEQFAWRGDSSPLLRIDAPGEHFEVEREIIALGAPDARAEWRDDRLLPFGGRPDRQPVSMKAALVIKEQRGRIYHPSQWFRGFGRLLARFEREAQELWSAPRWLNAPADIAGMFDKRQTHRTLTEAGVPVPRLLAPAEALADYEALRAEMLEGRMHRVFVKLAAGSGACGVVAYQLNPRTGEELAVTTIGVENYIATPPVYYNAVKPRRYSDPATIRQVLNWLLQHGAHVEQWIAKASVGGRAFDIRQLVVAGEACHSVARVSRTPITNLHLRSERMGLDEIGLSADVQQAVRECAERALSAFPHSRVAGIDVLLRSGTLTPFVADVNPFGDLLYRVLHKGYDTYTWELKWLTAVSIENEAVQSRKVTTT